MPTSDGNIHAFLVPLKTFFETPLAQRGRVLHQNYAKKRKLEEQLKDKTTVYLLDILRLKGNHSGSECLHANDERKYAH